MSRPVKTRTTLGALLALALVSPGTVGAGNDFAGTGRKGPHLERVAIGPEGAVWVAGWVEGGRGGYRIWELGQPGSYGVEDGTPDWVASLSFAPDGTLWAVGSSMATFDGEEWTQATNSPVRLAAPDGTLWFVHPRRGVEAWDGTTSTRYLKDRRISEISIAPDGSIWAVGEGKDGSAIYRITPDGGS